MPARLYAARYDDQAYAGTTGPSEFFEEIADAGLRWSFPGGLQRFELTVKARSRFDAYARYKDHLGHRIAFLDDMVDVVVAGQVYEVIPDGRHVTYIGAGPWRRANDDNYQLSDFPTSGDTDDIIRDILTDSVTIEDTDQSNINATSVDVGGWLPADRVGTLGGDAIAELAAIGHNDNTPMVFYFLDQRLNGVRLRKPKAYLEKRSISTRADWLFDEDDLAPDGLTMARNIWDLKTAIAIGYGRVSGLHDGGNGMSTLDDASATFVTHGIKPGDRVINITDRDIYDIAAVTSETVLTFTEGASGNWDNTDKYSVKMREPMYATLGTPSTSYWSVRWHELRMEMDATQAAEYRDQLGVLFADAQQQQAFVIGSPTIRTVNGNRWPLWRPLMTNLYHFAANDIFPEITQFSTGDDRRAAWPATAMDYTYRDNRLRVVPSTGDSRLDAILGRAGLVQGQIIATEAEARANKD